MPDFEDKIPISEFSYTNSLNNTDQMPIIQQDGAAWDNFRTSLTDVGLHVNKVTQYTTDLHTTNKTIIGAINEIAQGGASADITTEIDTPAPVMTFNDGGDNIPLKSLVTEIVPIQEGSGVPSPSNVRSISGVSDINLYCAGKNIYPIDYSHASQTVSGITFSFNNDGSVEMTGRATANTYPYAVTFRLPAGTYKKSPAINDIGILVQYIVSSSSWTLLSSATESEFTVTPEISQYMIVARVRVPNGKVLDHYKYYPFIYVGSETDLSFEKYIGQIKNIPLGQTVYGGSLECVKGQGQVTYDLYTFDGSEDEQWNENTTGIYYVYLNGGQASTEVEELTASNRFEVIGRGASSGLTNGQCRVNNLNTAINFRNDSITSLADWKTWLASNNIQILFTKSTPTSLSVSGANIPTLSGVNNVYTDCGDIQSLEYFNENGDDIASLVRLMSKDYREVLLPKRVTASVSTITSSSHDGNYYDWCAFNGRTPSNLRNPDGYTCWSAAQNETNAWIAVDLGSAKDLYEVQLDVFSNYSGDWVGNIAVQGSNDNTNWTSILASGNANIGIVAPLQQITSTIIKVSGSYRYVRIVGIDKFTVYYNPSCFFDEIFIYAKE